ALGRHLRNTFMAGAFAAVPVVVTVVAVLWIEGATREPLHRLTGLNTPFLGLLVALILLYLLGLLVTSLAGKWLLGLVDCLLCGYPMLREIYTAWKHISITPGGGEGIFARVCLIADEATSRKTLGFTSGEGLPGDPHTCCVFVPASPNPTNGRLYFVPRETVQLLDLSTEEAFKIILSGGNYMPEQLQCERQALGAAPLSKQ